MIQIQTAMATISNILMVKHGVNHSVVIVVRPQLDILHLTDGVVQIPTVTDGRIPLLTGWQVQGVMAMHGRLIQPSGMTRTGTAVVITHKVQLLTFVQTMLVHLLVQQKVEIDGAVLIQTVTAGQT